MEQDYQRGDMRAPVYGVGSLSWDDAGAGAQTSPVVVRNLSERGIQVVCEQPVRTGAAVFLTGDAYECLGEVKYCVVGDGGFRIGIELVREPYRRLADESRPV